MELNNKQKKFLKKEAHHLNPILQIGKNGLSSEVIEQVRDALEARELIKISLLQNTDEEPKEVAETLAEELGAKVVQVIGKVVILYKRASRLENQKLSEEVIAIH